MAEYLEQKQENLNISIQTPLGKDKLILDSFTGREYISAPFEFKLYMHSSDPDIDFDAIIGKQVTITLEFEKKKRYINGIVAEFEQTKIEQFKKGDPTVYYRAVIQPALWMLKFTQDHKIFQEKSALDIIKEVLKKHKVTKISDKTSAAGKTKRDYCVQYGETAFDFCSRLLEEEGIFYYFEHTEHEHTLVLSDQNSSSKLVENEPLKLVSSEYTPAMNIITQLNLHRSVVSAKSALTDYNFEKPTTKLLANSEGKGEGGEVYHYPGLYTEKANGDKLAKERLEKLEWVKNSVSGIAKAPMFSAGYSYKQDQHPRKSANTDYLLFEVEHKFDRLASDPAEVYVNHFKAIPLSIPYRPLLKTYKPRIFGNQTALVTGKPGEEIWTDKYGRIKVQFHWDRDGKKDDKTSCWVRCAQVWAATGWGGVFVPRIGMEVVVTFINGDPDHPLVTGCVYNGKNTPPYLPGEPTKSTIKSNSTKGGGGFNEMRFEDKKGSEEYYMHAQKDMLIEVENEMTTLVFKDDHNEEIKQGNMFLKVDKGNREKTIAIGNETIMVGGERKSTIQKDETRTNGMNYKQTVTQNMDIIVTGKITISAGADIAMTSGGNITMQAAGAINTQAGGAINTTSGAAMSMQAGGATTVESAGAITMESGGAVSVTPGGAYALNAGGAVQISGAAVTTISGASIAFG